MTLRFSPSNLSLQKLSPLIPFCDLLVGHRPPLSTPLATKREPEELSRRAFVDIAALNPVQFTFLKKILPSLRDSFKESGGVQVCISAEGQGNIFLFDHDSNQILSISQVLDVIRILEAEFESRKTIIANLAQPNIERCLAACARTLKEVYPEIFTPQMETLRAIPTVHFGIPDLLSFECCWEAIPHEGGIRYPNYPEWTPVHTTYRMRRLPESIRSIGRLWRWEMLQCYRTPCHEFIHCVQHFHHQRAPMQSAEHDAAFAELFLMKAVSVREDMREMYYPGLFEELALELLDFVVREVRESTLRWTEENRADYFAWRNGFGIAQEGRQWNTMGTFKTPDAENLLKYMLMGETMTIDGQKLNTEEEATEHFRLVAQTLFHDRTGDLSKLPPVVVPDQIALTANSTFTDRIAYLISPVPQPESAAFIAELRQTSVEGAMGDPAVVLL